MTALPPPGVGIVRLPDCSILRTAPSSNTRPSTCHERSQANQSLPAPCGSMHGVIRSTRCSTCCSFSSVSTCHFRRNAGRTPVRKSITSSSPRSSIAPAASSTWKPLSISLPIACCSDSGLRMNHLPDSSEGSGNETSDRLDEAKTTRSLPA